MEMPEPVKKYWPYMLGGVVGLYLLMRSSGGSSSAAPAQSSAGNYAAAIAQQNAYAAQAAQTGAQLTVAGYQRDAALAATAAAVNDSNNRAQVDFIAAQSQLAQNAGAATAGIITTLQQPAISAINAGTANDIATIQAAAAATQSAYAAAGVTAASSAAMAAHIAPSLAAAGGDPLASVSGIYALGASVVAPNTTGAQVGAITGMASSVVSSQAGAQSSMTASDNALAAKKNNDAWQAIGTAAAMIAA